MAEPVKAPPAPPPPAAPDTVDMVDHEGVTHAIPAAQAGEAYRSGAYGLRDDQTVYVRRGKDIVPVTGAAAGELFRSYGDVGGGVTSAEGFAKNEERKRFEGLGHEVAAPLVGAANALTLGTLPALLPQSGRDYVRAQREVNPGLTTGGEVAALLGSTLVSGGGSLAARAGLAGARTGLAAAEGASALGGAARLGLRAATLPLRGAMGLGRAVEGGVARVAGEGAIAHVAGRGLAGAAEMGVYGAGQAVGDTAIKGDDITAEKIVAGATHGAIIGGALTGGLAVGGLAAAAGARAAGRGVMSTGSAALNLGLRAARGLAGIGGRAVEAAEKEAAIGDEIVAGAQRAEAARAAGGLTAEEHAAGVPAVDGASLAEPKAPAWPSLDEARAGVVEREAAAREAAARPPAEPVGESPATAAPETPAAAVEPAPGAPGAPTAPKKIISDEEAAYELARTITGYGERAEARGLTTRDALFSDLAKDATLRSTGASQAMRGQLRKAGAEVEEKLVAQLHHDVPGLAGKRGFENVSRPEMAEAFEKLVPRLGNELGARLRALDELATGIKPDAYRATSRAVDEVLAPMQALGPVMRGHAAQVESEIEALADSVHGKGFADFHKVRAAFDKTINWQKTSGNTIVADALKEVRAIFESELEQSGEAAAAKAGGAFAASYKEAKLAYRAAKFGQEMTAKGAERDMANRGFGLTEHLGTLGGSSTGASVGGALLGPPGALVGAGVGGLAGLAMNHVTRMYGSQIAASVARRAATTDLLSAITQTVDARMGKGLSEFFHEAVKKSKEAARSIPKPSVPAIAVEALKVAASTAEGKQREFEEERKKVSSFAASGPAGAMRAVAGIAEHHPELAAKVAEKTMTVNEFLLDRLPPELVLHHQLTPQFDKSRAPQPLVDKWLAYNRYANNPSLVLEELGRGKATREGAEVLRECYPAMFKDAQAQIAQKLTELKKPLDYQKEQQLAILYDVPTRPCMTADFVQSQQAAYASAAAPAPAGPPRPAASGGAGSAIANLADTARSGAQKTGGHL